MFVSVLNFPRSPFPCSFLSNDRAQTPLPPLCSLRRNPVFLPAPQSQALSRKATGVQQHCSSEPQHSQGRTLLSELPAKLRVRAEGSLTSVRPLINTQEHPGTASSPAIFKWIVNTPCPCSEHPHSCPWGSCWESCLFFPLFLELVWHHKAFPQQQKRRFSFTSSKRRGVREEQCTLPQAHSITPWPLSTKHQHKHQSFRETFIIGLQNLCQYKVP